MYCVEMCTSTLVADPLHDGLMRLHRAVQDDGGAELARDDDVGCGEALLVIAALAHARLVVDERLAPHGLVRIEQRLADVPLDVDRRERRARLRVRVGADRRDGLPW